jgi:hypothetical protein
VPEPSRAPTLVAPPTTTTATPSLRPARRRPIAGLRRFLWRCAEAIGDGEARFWQPATAER